MLKKIVGISSVGRFVDYKVSGDMEFRKFNIIYGENGQGKSTLTHIFRSLNNNDDTHIKERNTLTIDSSPHIDILFDDNQKCCFKDGSWDKSRSIFEIFDATFVNENIFYGEFPELSQLRNAVKTEFLTLDEKQQEIRFAMNKLESSFLQRLTEFSTTSR